MGDPLDEYAAPPLYDGEWPPASWSVPQPGAQLQPGLGGIPASVVDAALAAPDPNEIAMPMQYADDPASIDLPMQYGAPALVPSPAQLDVAGGPAPAFPPAHWGAPDALPAINQNDPMPPEELGPLPTPGGEQEIQLDNVDASTPALRDAATRQELASISDEDLLRRTLEHEQAAKDDASAALLKASRENYAREKDDLEIRQKADADARVRSDQVYAEAAQLSQRKIDPDRRGAGSRILGAIAAFIGGLAAPSMGGRNPALEMIQRSIEQDIDAQKADIANAWKGLDQRKSTVAESFSRNRDEFVAVEAARIAAWKQVEIELQAQAQNYDSRGATALRYEGMIRGARAKAAEAAMRMESEAAKQAREAATAAFAQRKQVEAERQAREDEKVARQNANTASYNASVNAKKVASEIKIADAKLPLDIEKTNAEIADLKSKGKVKEAEQLQQFGIPGIETPDGKTFVATSGSPQAIDKMNAKLAKSRELISLLDEIRRTRSGWTTDTGNSEENQKLKALAGQVKSAFKDALDLGAITASDDGLIDGVQGYGDPTGRKSIEAGILQARKNIIRSRNEELKSHGYPGKWDVPDIQANKNVEQPGDAEAKAVMRDPMHVDNAQAELWPDGLINGEARGPRGAEVVAELAKHGGMLPSQRATLDGWAAAATGTDDAARRAAIEKLDVTAKTAESENVRNYALQALAASAHSAFPAPSPEAVQ